MKQKKQDFLDKHYVFKHFRKDERRSEKIKNHSFFFFRLEVLLA